MYNLYLDMHGLISKSSICYWQDQPDYYLKRTEVHQEISLFNLLAESLANQESVNIMWNQLDAPDRLQLWK